MEEREARKAACQQLRERTGWGTADCARFLRQNGWDVQRTIKWLGFKPEPPATYCSQITESEPDWMIQTTPIEPDLNAGVIESYIHRRDLGSLVEINCKTEAVAESEVFQRLAKDIAMQVCASSELSYVSGTNISPKTIAQERARILQRFESEHPADDVDVARRDQIVASMIQQRLEILPLLQQPYLRNYNLTLQARIDEMQEIVGEPIQVRRWVKFCRRDFNQKPMVAKRQSHIWKLEAVCSSNSWVRWQAVGVSPAFGKSAVPYLIRALQDSEGAIRYRAAESLGVLGDSSCVPALIQALQDPENWVRWKAAEALGRLKDPRAVPALVELLKNSSGRVFGGVRRSGCCGIIDMRALHRIAADALAEIGDPQAIELLLQTLSDREGGRSLPSGAKPQEIAALLQRLGYSLSPEMISD